MSPEHVQGRQVDTWSDVFSLGVMLYEMACGRRPFHGDSAIALMSAILKDDPASLNELPPNLGAVVWKCLDKDPEARYPNAAVLLDGLTRASLDIGNTETLAPEKSDPFVGREVERERLLARLDAAAHSKGTLVLIGGEPGVGKTRLVREILATARERGMLALSGHCYEEGDAPFGLLIEILEGMVMEVPAETLRETLGDAASQVAKLLPELRTKFDDIPEPTELPPEQQRRYLFTCVLDLFQRMGAKTPLAILVDDLHWADESMLGLLQHMARSLEKLPILVLGTYRDVELDVGKPFQKTMAALTRQKQAERVALKRLAESDVEELLAALGGAEPPRALVQVIFHETEGNPFFVTEVFHHLSEERKLFDEHGAFRNDLGADALDVPEGVRLVIGRRLERLADATPKMLTAAAVVGRRFELTVVEPLSNLDAEGFLDAIEEAENAKLITAETSERGTSYTFTHELIRHTLLAAFRFLEGNVSTYAPRIPSRRSTAIAWTST